jgi:hypothetical protein
MRTTEIAGREVPIQPGPPVTITFSGGAAGPSDAGVYEFWTLVIPQGATIVFDTARQRTGDDPGERWRRMEHAPGYEESYKRAKKAQHMKPAAIKLVEDWLNKHPADAECIVSCSQDGKPMKVSGPPYRLEPN